MWKSAAGLLPPVTLPLLGRWAARGTRIHCPRSTGHAARTFSTIRLITLAEMMLLRVSADVAVIFTTWPSLVQLASLRLARTLADCSVWVLKKLLKNKGSSNNNHMPGLSSVVCAEGLPRPQHKTIERGKFNQGSTRFLGGVRTLSRCQRAEAAKWLGKPELFPYMTTGAVTISI